MVDDSVLVALIGESMVGETPERQRAARLLLDLLRRTRNLDGLEETLEKSDEPVGVTDQARLLIGRYDLR